MEDNKVAVVIAGKSFKLSGYDPEHLNKVAEYLNKKHEECNAMESFKALSYDLQNIFLQLNIADDYFNAQKEIQDLKEEIERKNNEIYDIKHELVTQQMKHGFKKS